MKINVINILMLTFVAASLVSCKKDKQNFMKDCSFEVQADGTVNYAIEGGYKGSRKPGSTYNGKVYLVPIGNGRQLVDSAVVSPISGTFKMKGTAPRSGVYYVISDTTLWVASRIFAVKLFDGSLIVNSERDDLSVIGTGEIEGAPDGVVYVYHSSDTLSVVDAVRTGKNGIFNICTNCLSAHGEGYYSIRYKSEGRLIYSADSIFLSDTATVRLYGKWNGDKR